MSAASELFGIHAKLESMRSDMARVASEKLKLELRLSIALEIAERCGNPTDKEICEWIRGAHSSPMKGRKKPTLVLIDGEAS